MNFIKSKPKPKSTAVLQFCGQIRWFVCLYFIHFRNNKLKRKDGTHRWIVQNEWTKCTMVQWISGAHSSGTVTLLRNQNKLSNHNFQFFEQTVHLSVFENHLGMCNKIFYEFMALGAVHTADTWVYKNSKHEFCVFTSKHALWCKKRSSTNENCHWSTQIELFWDLLTPPFMVNLQ